MSIEDAVRDKLRALPVEKQREVLAFAASLQRGLAPKGPRKSVKGLWRGMGIRVTAEDIAEARREMWGSFPREFPKGNS